MVSKVLPAAQLIAEALAAAETIARNAPISVRQAKLAISRGVNMSLWDGLVVETEAYYRMVPTEDRREGIAAFNEKRPAKFQGR
jgi:enoyl-CoA hydratase/carnithine racemase